MVALSPSAEPGKHPASQGGARRNQARWSRRCFFPCFVFPRDPWDEITSSSPRVIMSLAGQDEAGRLGGSISVCTQTGWLCPSVSPTFRS